MITRQLAHGGAEVTGADISGGMDCGSTWPPEPSPPEGWMPEGWMDERRDAAGHPFRLVASLTRGPRVNIR